MIDEVDQQLSSWVEDVLPGASVTFEGPATATDDVGLFLFELADLPPARGEERPPLQVRLGYLVTTSGADVALAHKRLGTLLFAALTHPGWEVRFPGDTAELWRAVGETPRAGFILSVPLRQPVEAEPAPPVRVPLRVQGVGSRAMEGVVRRPRRHPDLGRVHRDSLARAHHPHRRAWPVSVRRRTDVARQATPPRPRQGARVSVHRRQLETVSVRIETRPSEGVRCQ